MANKGVVGGEERENNGWHFSHVFRSVCEKRSEHLKHPRDKDLAQERIPQKGKRGKVTDKPQEPQA